MTPKELKKLRDNQPYGHLRMIAEKTGYSRNYVWLVLQGKRYNFRIIEEAFGLAKQHKEQIDKFRKKAGTL